MTETLAESLARRLREVDPDVRSAIRVEAMRECEALADRVYMDSSRGAIEFVARILVAIREKIAKEQSNG